MMNSDIILIMQRGQHNHIQEQNSQKNIEKKSWLTLQLTLCWITQ